MKDNLNEKELVSVLRGGYLFGDTANLMILFELQRYGEKNFTELKNMLGINPSSLTKKLRLLEKAGLVSADRSRKGIKVYYRINETGHKKSLRRFIDAFERLSYDIQG